MESKGGGREGEIDFKEWVHLTMEAEKYQVPESACQRRRRADGVKVLV